MMPFNNVYFIYKEMGVISILNQNIVIVSKLCAFVLFITFIDFWTRIKFKSLTPLHLW